MTQILSKYAKIWNLFELSHGPELYVQIWAE